MASPDHLPRPERELQAYRETGVTAVSPRLARWLTVGFLATICLIPAVEGVRRLLSDAVRPGSGEAVAAGVAADPAPTDDSLLGTVEAYNRRLRDLIARCDDWTRTGSAVPAAVRPWVQAVLAHTLGAGSEQVLIGRDGWLFFRPAVDHLVGPPFLATAAGPAPGRRAGRTDDPVAAIADLRDQLALRGIELVLLPVPVKAALSPERLGRVEAVPPAPLENPSTAGFRDALAAAGVHLLDPTPTLLALARSSRRPAYLASDTHWTPAAMEAVATALAVHLRDLVPLPPAAPGLQETVITVRAPGDLATMLDLPPGLGLRPSQEVTIHPVAGSDGAPLQPRRGAPVLLLGDSFANIYSRPELGWGAAAGLGERLAFHLGWPIDAITHNDDGAIATRRDLTRELAADPGRLAAVRVVVWELTERELSRGDWRPLSLPAASTATAASSASGRFVHLPRGASVLATGSVAAAAEVADPRAAPYADYVRALLLTDLTCEPPCDGDRALVFVSAMEDRALSFGAAFAVGDRIRLRLSSWAAAPERLHSASRGELLDADLLLETPLWGEEITP